MISSCQYLSFPNSKIQCTLKHYVDAQRRSTVSLLMFTQVNWGNMVTVFFNIHHVTLFDVCRADSCTAWFPWNFPWQLVLQESCYNNSYTPLIGWSVSAQCYGSIVKDRECQLFRIQSVSQKFPPQFTLQCIRATRNTRCCHLHWSWTKGQHKPGW